MGHVVMVSDGIYSDACLYDEPVEQYRRGLAQIDMAMAKICDVVLEVAYGSVIPHKGDWDCPW